MITPTPEPAAESRARVWAARQAMVAAIAERRHKAEQNRLADAYITEIKRHSTVIGRRLPVPSRAYVLRALAP
jgi:hypothetical protein